MTNTIKRIVSLMLCLVMTLSIMMPSALALTEEEALEIINNLDNVVDNGFLDLSVVATDGAGKVDGPHRSSFVSYVVLNSDGSRRENESVRSFDIIAKYQGNMSVDLPDGTKAYINPEIRVWVSRDDANASYDDADSKDRGNQEISMHIDNPTDTTSNYTWYVYAEVCHPNTHQVMASGKMSIAVLSQYGKISNISYSQVGVQVRYVDNTMPLGKYDYKKNHADKQIARTDGYAGTWFGVGDGKYTGMNGVSYDNCYFDIIVKKGTSVSGIDNQTELMAYIAKLKEKAETIGTTWQMGTDYVLLSGPSYCAGKISGEIKERFSMAYYQKTDKDTNIEGIKSINKFASWGPNTLNDFEAQQRYVTFQIPLINQGTVTINFIDEDTGKMIKEPEIRKTTTYNLPESLGDYNAHMWSLSSTSSNRYQEQYGEYDLTSWESIQKEMKSLEGRKRLATNWIYDKVTKKLEKKEDTDAIEKIREMIKVREYIIADIIDGVKTEWGSWSSRKYNGLTVSDSTTTSKNITGAITAPKIDGYVFDFGYGEDALSLENMSPAPPLMLADTPYIVLVANGNNNQLTMNLYYKADGETEYTVKVRINGEIDESLTEKYPAHIGDIIEEKDVDTSKVPPDAEIKDIENVPLEVTPDPEKNIIIIDCEKALMKYTVMYYLDGVFKESDVFEAEKGEVISTAPAKGYPGYKFDHATGVPLTIVDSTGVIRVYYVKNVEAAAANPNAKLFKDEYRTQITKEKSGYGVYGLFYVDMTTYVTSKEYPSWTVNGGCGPAGRSKVEWKYQKTDGSGSVVSIEDAKVTATWKEGLNANGKINENGRTVTVNMEIDREHSTSKVWAFHFPKNPGSSKNYPKAYIPVNTPDGKNTWKVDFKLVLNYLEYSWWNSSASTSCRGHRETYYCSSENCGGHSYTWYHTYTIYPLEEKLTSGSVTKTATAYLSIQGSMYEDDFTGGRQ